MLVYRKEFASVGCLKRHRVIREKVLTEYICQEHNDQGDASPCSSTHLKTQQLVSEPGSSYHTIY